MSESTNEHRRQVKSRQSPLMQKIAKLLAKTPLTPNMVSVLSMVGAGISLFFYIEAKQNIWLLLFAVLGIQIRLLCNLFDGMLAVEHQKHSRFGEIYNEVPDRVSDTLIILGAGLFIQQPSWILSLTWLCIFLSIFTAYVRVLGASLSGKHRFAGPMAKQHRMFLITLASLLNLFWDKALLYALIIMSLLLVVTVINRLYWIALDSEEAKNKLR